MKSAGVFNRRLLIVERLSYFLILVPWLTDFIEKGAFPTSGRGVLTEIVLGAIIIVFIVVLRLTRKEIVSLDFLRESLAQAVIHDLKGPLTSIMGSLSVVNEQPELELERREKLLCLAMDSSRSLMKLVEMLLDTDRLESSQLLPRRQELNALDLLRDRAAEASVLCEQAGIKLEISGGVPVPLLRADKDLLSRVIDNLLHNSLKYTSRGGVISLRADYLEGAFYFEVADTGTGIPQAHIGRVFDKFYRVEGRTAGSRSGSGLGLYFCKLAVHAHGGKIGVESGRERGTKVFFTIPQVE